MRVTVCELSNDPEALARDWRALVSHVRSEASDLVLLPEMPFHPWLPRQRRADPDQWQAAVTAHDRWLTRLPELAPAIVVGTRPVVDGDRRLNEGFAWQPGAGYTAVHRKRYLPDEDGFWEATWYQRGAREFSARQLGGVRIGFLICTELWFTHHAREYASQGVELLVCPRATPAATVDKWLAGGRTAAVVSGAYCLSSNFGGGGDPAWGGAGWVMEPDEGEMLGVTTRDRPFLTCQIDLRAAASAKRTYPRYVRD